MGDETSAARGDRRLRPRRTAAAPMRGVVTSIVVVVVVCAMSGASCASAPPPDVGAVTVPPGTSRPTIGVGPSGTANASTTITTVPPVGAGRVSLGRSWFGRPSAEAIAALQAQGFTVADFRVCSGSVQEGQVRQILTGAGVILDDRDGLTDAGRAVEPGAVLQMKVGTGVACG